MVRLSLAAGLAGLAGVAGFQRQAPRRPTTVLQYKKTAKEMRAKYPEGGKVPYVLTKDAPPHGVAGDVLKVNRGFANNYLAPQGLGEPASAEQIAAFEVKLAERAAAEAAAFDAAAAQAQQLMAKGDVSISRAAGEDGGVEAVSAQDVQQVLGLDSSAKVTLPKMDGFGDYTVTVQLHKQVKVELPLKLVGPLGAIDFKDRSMFDDKLTTQEEFRFNGVKNGPQWKGRLGRYFISKAPILKPLLEWAEKQDRECIDFDLLKLAVGNAMTEEQLMNMNALIWGVPFRIPPRHGGDHLQTRRGPERH